MKSEDIIKAMMQCYAMDCEGCQFHDKNDCGKCEELIPIAIDLLKKQNEELAAYRAAEQDGTLLRLPCKVGDMVFVDKRTLFQRRHTKGVSEDIATGKVVSFRKNKTSTFVKIKFYFKEGSRTYFENYVLSAFGKTVFLTLESAEAVLKEQEGQK